MDAAESVAARPSAGAARLILLDGVRVPAEPPGLILAIIALSSEPRELMAAFRASGRGGRKGGKFELTEEQRQEIREAFDLFDTGERR